jgi:predicted RNA-binding Zn ribbon-like protein
MADDRALRFDCGATWLNLLATRGRHFGARPVERLPTPERLVEWLHHSELTPVQPPQQADLAQTWELREILRPLALATVAAEPLPSQAVADLGDYLPASDPIRLTIVGDRLIRQQPRTTRQALARIARQAVDHLTTPERLHLKTCPEHDCRGVFADPGDRRRWCPSPACASRGRVRALRARRTGSAP